MNKPLTPPNNAAPVAVIGMACLFPQAPDMQAFWNNILSGLDAVGDPSAPWDAGRYLDSGRIKTSSGGYLKDLYRFDPREFGIMPNSMDGGEPDQFLALRVARDALRDAGYFRDDYDHRDTGIILGHSTYLHRGQGTLVQNHIVVDQTLEVLKAALPELDDAALAEVRAMLRKKLPQSNADTAPGLVPNVMTGRIANRLNLRGPNYLVDAACSSSLLAVSAAMDELRAGRSQLMLAGGVNASLPAEVSVIFSQLGALSGRGKVRPFEEGSDGTLLGEGLGVVVLKRLSDALADGDRVYSVLREVGQASDGRGHGLLAPSVDGETLAIQRAYRSSGIDPASIGMIEAHGTGIPLGDKTEVSALRNVFGERRGAQGSIAFGSVKSMISHCIPAAGIAGLIKSSLALHHRVLPPTLCAKVNPELGIDKTPLFINTEAMPWLAPQGVARRAGIDSFGFGGINAHAIVEQAPADAKRPDTLSSWPAELCVFAAPTRAELIDRLRSVASAIAQHPEWRLADIAATLQSEADAGEHRLALVAKDVAGLVKAMNTATGKLEGSADRWSTRTGAHYSAVPLGGQMAFLFPGEGSQYMGMLGDLAMLFSEVREWLDFWRGLYPSEPGQSRTDIVFPPAMDVSEERRSELDSRLHDMDVGSEAVFVGGQAMNSLLRSFGVVPDVMLGHSSGESAALAASGAIAAGDRSRLAEFIRELNQVYQKVLAEGKIPVGALLAVGAMPADRIQALIAEQGRGVSVAMDNCANQLIVYGDKDSIAELQATLVAAGAICMPLPFDRGYHTDDFAAVRDAFLAYYKRIGVGLPEVPMYSCATAEKFPGSVAAVRKLAAAQWSTTVRFRETVARMHDDGVRCFVEVGPSGNLTAFVNDVLAGRDQVAMASNLRGRPGVEHFLGVLAQLYVLRRPVDLSRMFSGRAARRLDMSLPASTAVRGVLLDNTMPMVRLDDKDRHALQAIAQAARPAQVTAAPPVAPPEPEAIEAADAPVAGDQPPASHAVMSGYFGVMREFLAQQQQVLERWQDRGHEPEPAPMELPADGFIHEIVELDDEHLVSRCRLGLHTDNFLRDHILSGPVSATDPDLHGLACVPMMVSLEIMAQSCSALAGSRRLSLIENVRAFDWIALDDGEIELEVRVDRVAGPAGRFKALLSQPQGKAVSAEFTFETSLPAAEPLAVLSEYRPSLWNDENLYTSGMFHGPVFQSISHIDGWDPQGIDARLSRSALADFFVQGHTPAMVTNPVILDAMGQLAAFWLAQYAGTDFNCFPSTIDRIEFLVDCPADLPGLRLRGRQQPVEGESDQDIAVARRWAFECVDADERPLIRVSGLANVFFPVQNRFYRVRLDPRSGCLGAPLAVASEPGVALWQLEHFSEDFSGQSGGIFLRILAHACLSFEELDEWRGLAKNVRHRRQWLLGRICLKEAVRQWVLDQTGELLFPSDIIVVHDAQGAPGVDGWWCDTLTPAPSVSLSHNDRWSVAAVAEAGLALGVDVEDLGARRNATLLLDSLTEAERLWVGQHAEPDRLRATLEVWCAKEAASKWTGQGLQGQPNAFEVTFVNTSPPVAAVAWNGTHIQVTLSHDNQSVIAVARSLYMSTREHQ